MKQSLFMRVLFCKIHCPSFICFCKPSAAHLYTPGPLKLDNTPHVPSTAVSISESSDLFSAEAAAIEPKEENLDGRHQTEDALRRSCLRKAPTEPAASKEAYKKRVQWMDDIGKELTEIKEFESSEMEDTDSEMENRVCACVIL